MLNSLRLGKMPFLACCHTQKRRFSLRLSLFNAFATAAKGKPPCPCYTLGLPGKRAKHKSAKNNHIPPLPYTLIAHHMAGGFFSFISKRKHSAVGQELVLARLWRRPVDSGAKKRRLCGW